MHVTHFERLPMPGGYSVERVFSEIRHVLPAQIAVEVVRCETPNHSRWWLIKGIARARRRASRVNHIVGDIQYVAMGLTGNRTVLRFSTRTSNRLYALRGLRRLLLKWVYFSLPLRRCRFVTVISESTRTQLVTLFPFVAHKTIMVPCCLPDGFQPVSRRLNVECPRVLQVGTGSHKNLERAAYALVGMNCIFHVVGRLNREQHTLLTRLNIRLENTWDLTDRDILKAYERADIVLFVSLSEGFGMPVIEANAIGRPVITSNISPMKDVAG